MTLFSKSPFETQIEGDSKSNFNYAQVKLWLPESKTPPNSLICVVLGSGMNGLDLVDDVGWRQLAQELQAGLLTFNFNEAEGSSSWHIVEKGSGQALIQALDILAQEHSLAYLKNIPLVFIGLSTGGQYAYHFACWKPERTLAFITLKGGHHRTDLQRAILKTPALWVTASEDMAFRQENIKNVFHTHQQEGAPWLLAVEPNAGHASENTSRLIGPYLKTILLNSKREGLHAKNSFTKLLNDFKKGNNLEAWPRLSLSSKKLPEYATASVANLNFDSCESGRYSKILDVQLTAKAGSPIWNRVQVVDPDTNWHVVKDSTSGNLGHFQLRLKVSPDLPLGLFKTLARFRFYQNDQLLLGGLNLPVMIRICGDVVVSPTSLYVGILDGKETVSKFLNVRSQSGKELSWIPEKSFLPSFVKIEVQDGSKQKDTLQLRCTFNPTDSLQLEEAESCQLQLCFHSDREWKVKVPALMSIKP